MAVGLRDTLKGTSIIFRFNVAINYVSNKKINRNKHIVMKSTSILQSNAKYFGKYVFHFLKSTFGILEAYDINHS